MAKLNKAESAQIMALMEKPGWEMLVKLATATIYELNNRPASGTNAFETLRSLHIREGKVEALKEFFTGLENGVSLSA